MQREQATGPTARAAVWLPLSSVAAFAAVHVLGLVAFPTAVLAVTLLAAVGWVGVGFGGGLVDPFEDDDVPDGEGSAVARGLLVYLTATTALGWAVLVLSGI